MTAALGHFIMRHPEVKGSMEQFLVQHVLPEFTSSEPYMRAIVSRQFASYDFYSIELQACEVLGTVEKSGLQWSNDDVSTLADCYPDVSDAFDAESSLGIHGRDELP